MLLRKQTAYEQTFETEMVFSPSRAGYEAGIVLWWNQYSYATIGVTLVELPSGESVPTVVSRSPSGRAGFVNVSNPNSASLAPHAHHTTDPLSLCGS